MRLVVSKPEDSATAIDGAPRGGIGSRLQVSFDEVEEAGGLRTGLGMNSSRAKMTTTSAVMEMFEQKETPGGKDKKRWSEDDESKISPKPRKKGKKRSHCDSR